MKIVPLDQKGRKYLLREHAIDSEKAVIIHRGDNFLLIPIPKEIILIKTNKTITELKTEAEKQIERETQITKLHHFKCSRYQANRLVKELE